MDNLSKKDIDYIFQKGTDKQEFPFKESSWDNMEAMLDADDNKRAFKRYLALGLFLLVSTALLYTFIGKEDNPTKKAEPITSPIASTEQVESSNEIDANLKSELTINSELQKNNNALSKKSTIVEDSKIAIIANPASSSTSKKSKNNVRDNSASIDLKDNASNRSTSPSLANVEEKSKPIFIKSNVINSDSPDKNLTKNSVGDSVENSSRSERSKLAINTSLPTVSLNPIRFSSKSINDIKPLQFDEIKNNRFTYSLVLARDWSSVGKMSNTKRGFRIGAEIAYQFGKKFQLGTGFIFSRKQYETAGENYMPEIQFRWVDDIAPETVEGSCDIFEIPLEFTYFFKGYDRNSFFVSAGANTYIMNDEWYDFRWDDQEIMSDPNIPKYSTSNELDSKSLHFMGVGTVSVGYQKYFNKNIAIQVGPYVQLPFTGIGMGNVNLLSTGLQFKMSFSK